MSLHLFTQTINHFHHRYAGQQAFHHQWSYRGVEEYTRGCRAYLIVMVMKGDGDDDDDDDDDDDNDNNDDERKSKSVNTGEVLC